MKTFIYRPHNGYYALEKLEQTQEKRERNISTREVLSSHNLNQIKSLEKT